MSGPPRLPTGLRAEAWTPMGGGSICEVWRVDLADGTPAVAKRTPYDAELEAEGLRALAEAGAPVPAVLGCSPEVLVLRYVDGPPDWEGLGRALARTHRTAGRSFGWHRDNLLGTLPQSNRPSGDWPHFFAGRRLRPFLDAVPAEVAARIEGACDTRLACLFGHAPQPSLVHGDLWPGNVVAGRWLIDPAVHHADREYDLAVAALFGGVPEALERAYREVWPLPEDWQRRRAALQLPHLLAHVKMFGQSWLGAVVQRLDALGW